MLHVPVKRIITPASSTFTKKLYMCYYSNLILLQLYTIYMDPRYAIGIDIGGTNLRAAVISETGKILKRVQHSSEGAILPSIAAAVEGINDPGVIAIGVAAAGLMDRRRGVISLSPNLAAVENLDLVKELGDRFGLPVVLENDANLAAFGEKEAGAGKDFSSFILLTLGTGIGGGVVHKGGLLDISAEIGHIVVEPDGIQCTCGNHGCLEEYAAKKAMVNMAVSALERGEESILRKCCEGNIYKITPRSIYEGAMEGDSLSREILKTAGKYLGIAFSNLANIFSPDAFILAGGLTNAWDIYVEEAIKEAEKRAFKGLFNREMVVRSSIREDAGLIGAGLYALHKAS